MIWIRHKKKWENSYVLLLFFYAVESGTITSIMKHHKTKIVLLLCTLF